MNIGLNNIGLSNIGLSGLASGANNQLLSPAIPSVAPIVGYQGPLAPPTQYIPPTQSTGNTAYNSVFSTLGNTISDAFSGIGKSLFGENGKGGLFNNNNYLGWANLGLNAYAGLQQLGLARDMYNLSNDQWNTQKQYMAKNYANSVQDYNRALADVAATRAKIYGDAGYEQRYYDQYSIKE